METTLLIRYRIDDFDRFKPVFDDFGANRRAHGAIGHRLLQLANDPREMVVMVDFPSPEAAQGFLNDPERADALVRAGIDSESDRAEPLEEIEQLDY
ncbi:MAG: hypothetical protein OEM67_06105 [Thermoleophilia bacterium]|nr:hypothetical protein [Thermoleophilia bacterium]MDH3725631.1 hypothetical protein [Thermoleophilia bacterium]